jgi:repressor LexA
MTFSEILKQWNGGIWRGVTTRLAKSAGVSLPTASGWINGDVPGEESLRKLSKILDVGEQELRDSFVGGEETRSRVVQMTDMRLQYMRIPIVGTVSAEKFSFSYAHDTGESIEIALPPMANKKTVALRIEGACMEPTARNGEFAIVAESDSGEIQQGGLAVLQCNGESTLKRVHRMGDHIELRPDNKKFKTIKVKSEDELHVIGKVMWIVRKP